jgi:hypothetical protein
MVPQAKDANGDGIIDGDGGVPRRGALSLRPSPEVVGAGNRIAQPNERLIDGALSWYLSPRGFPVRLDACASRGDDYRWRITRAGVEPLQLPWRALSNRTCRRTVMLPEAQYSLTLEVRNPAGASLSTVVADVRNVLVVSLGDSYASGEGNPRNVGAWLRRGGTIDPYWDDDACNRSARGAPAQAALELERRSPYTSVTLVYVACSGATVDSGILGAQTGAGQGSSQIEQAAAIVGAHPVDLVLLSVGGNDVGFTSILQTCALNDDCPLARPSSGSLTGYRTVQDGVQAQTGALSSDFDRIAACLGGADCRLADGRSVPALTLAPDARVFPSLYPDITRDAAGRPCSYLTVPTEDFAWARATILSPAPVDPYPYPLAHGGTAALPVGNGSLNQQVAATARLPGWLPVTGTWSASGDSPEGHGVCAGAASWVFGFTGFSGLPSASFHPDPTGQAVMARAIAAAAASAVVR